MYFCNWLTDAFRGPLPLQSKNTLRTDDDPARNETFQKDFPKKAVAKMLY